MKQSIINFLFIILFLNYTNAQVTATDWYNKGVKLNDSLKHTTAIAAFEKAIALDANYADAYYRLGWTYNELEAYDKAMEKLNKALLLKKDYAYALQELGYAYRKKGNYTEALNYLNKAIVIKADYSEAYKQLGDVYIALKRETEAITAYEKTYTLNNKNSSACYELGYLYNEMGKYDLALTWLNKAAATKSSVNTFNEIGFANYKLKKNDESLTAYKSALLINSLNGTAYKGMGDVYRINYTPAKTTEAIENYRKAIQNNPTSSGSYFGLGWCYNELKIYDSSIINLKKSAVLDDQFISTYTELGYAQYMKGFNNDALITLNKGVALDAKATLPLYYKGFVYVAQKDKTNATKMYNELKPLDNSLAEKLLVKINAL